MTKLKATNPWVELPTKPEYILPQDLEQIQFHLNFSNLRLETLPGQFAGGLDSAEVILLALNPGFNERDNSLEPEIMELICSNHSDPYGSSFYYLDTNLERTPVYAWWARILNPLLLAGINKASLRKKLMLIEYFPYHSETWKPLPVVPSQPFAFGLVEEAMIRQKTIVIMRSGSLWYKSIPSLESYPNKIVIKNPRQPYISVGNLGNENFNTILTKLTT